MYRPKPVPFNDGCAVASMDMSTEYKVTLFTSEGTKGAKQAKFERLRSIGTECIARVDASRSCARGPAWPLLPELISAPSFWTALLVRVLRQEQQQRRRCPAPRCSS
jgi:hypothetical protein